jgi:hypothetical protein
MTTTTVSRPVTVDTELARIWTETAKAEASLAGTVASAHRIAGDRGYYAGRTKVYALSGGQCLAAVRTLAETDETYKGREAADLLARRAGYQAEHDALRAEAAPLEAEFAAAPWTRFFLVQGGHIHSSTSCSTCNNGATATTFGWLPALSGLTEADAVAAHGAILCTVCYPSAPVEWTNGREVEAAAKAAARCPGTGKYVPGNRRYVRCPDCSATVARTPSGLTRAHKPA